MLLSVTLFNLSGSTAQRQLGTASGIRWVDDIDNAGSFQFSLPLEDATGVQVGSVIKFALGDKSDDWVFAGTVEDIKVEKTGEQTGGVARIAQITGRGLRARLEDAVVYPTGTEQIREFTGQTAGAIFKTLFDEAQARGALSGFTLGFTPTLDSEGAAYSTTLTLDVSVGDTLSEVADQHQELAVDVWVTPERVINYANARGVNRTTGGGAVVLRAGQSVSEILADQKGPITNTVLISYGASGNTFLTTQNASSATTYGRREAFLSLANTSDTAVITLSSTKLLDSTSAPSDSRTIQLADNGPTPYVDFQLGDTVKLSDIDGTQQNFRVRSITVTEDESGRITFVPELGTTRADLDRRLARALNKVERGDLGGESVVATPPSTGGGGAQPLVTGTVTSYVSLSKSGNVDLAGGGTSTFLNGTGFELAVGDEVVLTEVEGVTGLVVIGWIDRVGGYDPIVFPTPLSVLGFPIDLRNYPYPVWITRSTPVGSSPGTGLSSNTIGTEFDYGASGTLNAVGRKLVIQTSSGAVIHNLESNSTSIIPGIPARTPVFVFGDSVFAVNNGGNTGTVIGWNAATGVTTTYNIGAAIIGGVSDGRLWIAGRTHATNDYRFFSIDSAGTLSTGPVIPGATVDVSSSHFCQAGNGYAYATTSASTVAVVPTTNPAASAPVTIRNTGTHGLPVFQSITLVTGTAESLLRLGANVGPDGHLYWAIRTGSPAAWGFRKLNPTNGVMSGSSNIWSTTGNTEDGEPSWVNSVAVINAGVLVMGGAVRVDALGLPLDAYVEYSGSATSQNVLGAAPLSNDRFLTIHHNGGTARWLEIRNTRGEQVFGRLLPSASSSGSFERAAMTELSDGKLLVASGAGWAGGNGGSLTGGVSIIRLNADLTTDATFTQQTARELNALGVQADGKVVIGGTFTTVGATSRTRLARLNADGTLDTGYTPTADAQVRSLIIQADGKAVIAGDFAVINGVNRQKIARLNTDGTLDTGFPGEVFGYVNKILRLSSGKLVIVGAFTQVGLTPRANVALLNTDGTLDTSLTANTNGEVYDVAVQADGSLILAGNFTTVNGSARSYLARVSSTGTLDSTFSPVITVPIWHALVTSTGDIWVGARASSGTAFLIDGVARSLQRAMLRSDGTHKCTEYLPVTAVTDGLTTTKFPMTWLKDKLAFGTATVRRMANGEYAIIATSNSTSSSGPFPAWADGVNLNV